MADGYVDVLRDKRAAARKLAYETPIEELHPARASLFRDDAMWPTFERLRKESPVHYTPDSNYGAYWSITRYNDILAVDSNHQVFSSAKGITLTAKAAQGFRDPNAESGSNFIAMDPPRHDVQRKTVSPALSPMALSVMAPLIRERAGLILDSLPVGEEFDWVEHVSKELTTMTLATLFDFPFEERRKLTFWSDAMTTA
ncbi:MAG: cytochrome P450, partial [Phenylobacterium sp.]|nr:cytochrome P450 [Phenylobacterium sp.]